MLKDGVPVIMEAEVMMPSVSFRAMIEKDDARQDAMQQRAVIKDPAVPDGTGNANLMC